MDTSQINDVCRRDQHLGPLFLGTFPCDRLPSATPPVFGLCVNTGSSRTLGYHWQSIFVRHGRCYHFDSFGEAPRGLIRRFCLRFKTVAYNKVAHQKPTAITCGGYSIYHLCMQARGRRFPSIVRDFIRIDNDDEVIREWLRSNHNIHLHEEAR